jgi:hypothetical protein
MFARCEKYQQRRKQKSKQYHQTGKHAKQKNRPEVITGLLRV